MWFLNYCSPFRYQIDGQLKTSRYVMYITLAILFCVYVFYIIKYKFVGKLITVKAAYLKDDVENNKMVVSYAGFGQRQYRINQKKFKQWYLHYFGLHSVAVAAAIMYSPFYSQMVFTIIYTVCLIICTILQSVQKKGKIRILFNVLLIVAVLLDVILLFTSSMGVGASGYDDKQKICYFQR